MNTSTKSSSRVRVEVLENCPRPEHASSKLLQTADGVEHARQGNQPDASLPYTILRGTLLTLLGLAALVLLTFGLTPVVFVTLLLVGFALSPVILFGVAIVVAADVQQDRMTHTHG